MALSHPLSYLQALELAFKTDSSFTKDVYKNLKDIYNIMGDAELYLSMMTLCEDRGIDEFHVSTLQLMEDSGWSTYLN